MPTREIPAPAAYALGHDDAVVGRFILHHLGAPSALLREVARLARPGGGVAFVEYDFTLRGSVWPPDVVCGWCRLPRP